MGAVVMPHNLFLHSEIIQSRQWHLEDEKVIKRQLDFELFDTLFSMILAGPSTAPSSSCSSYILPAQDTN